MAGVKIDAARKAAIVAKYSYGGGGSPIIPDMADFIDDILSTIEAGELGAGVVGTGEIASGAITDGLIASKIVKDAGRLAVGLVAFAAKGDCTSVTVGAATYAYDATPVVANGEWAYGADAAASATNLAAAINGDTRNAGGPSYKAVVGGAGAATVYIFQLVPGGNPTVARVGGAQPATAEGMVGGGSAEVKQTITIRHTVTTVEGTNVEVHIPLPFAPTNWTWVVLASTGAIKPVTDIATVETTPDRIKVATAGATHIAATDVIVVIAQS